MLDRETAWRGATRRASNLIHISIDRSGDPSKGAITLVARGIYYAVVRRPPHVASDGRVDCDGECLYRVPG
jgi:hypothetical protein